MPAELEARLERLERKNETLEAQNRRIKRVGLAVLAVSVVALSMGQAATKDEGKVKFKSIDVEELTIVDSAGKARVEIGLDGDGAGIAIRDARGKIRVVLGEGKKEGAGAWVFDDKERPRVGLGIGKDGAGLIVLDENGKPIAGQGNR